MKKLFFFRSSTDKQVCAEHSSKSGSGDQGKNRDVYCSEKQSLDHNPALRRSRSFSSAAFLGNAAAHRDFPCLSDQSSSPSSSGSIKAQQHNHPPRYRTLTPERNVKTKRVQEVALQGNHEVRKPVSPLSSRGYRGSSGNSSLSSSNVSNEVLDLYIDGEQQNERSRLADRNSWKDHIANVGDKKPPRSHGTAPASPTASLKGNSRSHSFRGARGSHRQHPSRDWVETGFAHESPQELAKHVVERLSQTHISPGTKSMDYDSDAPITIEDVYNGSLSRSATLKTTVSHYKGFPSERAFTEEHQPGGYLGFEDNVASFGANSVDELDVELNSKLKEAQGRILFLSEGLEQQSFLQDVEFNVPALVQRIKSLTEEKVSLALEVSAALESQLADRTSMKEQLRSQSRKLDKEKHEIQSALEKELDRRSSDWSSKVEKFRVEEQRLRERVRELAEQNVSLQREVSSFREMETERTNMISYTEKQIQDLSSMLESAQRENEELRQNFCQLQDQYKVAAENRDCMQNTYWEKEDECKELHACVTRLVRTCSEQEKTIDGLRGELAESVQKKLFPVEGSDKHVQKLQMEQIRLTEVEQNLRREIESYKFEVDSLRCENINLLNRLKGFGKHGGSLIFKLDRELWARLQCLQKQGLSSLDDSTHLCSKLLDYVKKVGKSSGKNDCMEANGRSLDAQFVIESEVKVQGFKRGTESLMRSLQNIATILDEKAGLIAAESQTQDITGFGVQNGWNSQDLARSELKAEMLLTSLLREKLYAKDREVEQLQGELAATTRGKDILRCELQNALDSLSCTSHKMKELELQMIKKEEKINQLQANLQESMKEVSMLRGILPKVTEERDTMWQEVKQCTEKNMLLNSEVSLLKKKVDALDEDVLLKEGQIAILKDSLGRKSFDLLASPERTHEFLLE